jgi:histidine triad (HIT) family protein
MSENCLVCRQIDGRVGVPGGPLLEDELLFAFHVPPREEPTVYLGHLQVCPRRHVAGLGDLDENEAAGVGVAAALLARALRRAGAEHVYAAVIGHHADHFHLHLLARWPGTPREYWWTRVDDWPDARRGDFDEAAGFAGLLRASLHS